MPDKPPNVDQLRYAIDHGAAGDKVDFPDPAAAPLGTDAEAGGFPPTAEELKLAATAIVPVQPTPRLPAIYLYLAMVLALTCLFLFLGYTGSNGRPL